MLVIVAMNAIVCVEFMRQAVIFLKKGKSKSALLFLVGAVFFGALTCGCFYYILQG